MASKVFVSYKFADNNVAYLYSPLYSPYSYTSTTARSYVDDFKRRAENEGCIVYKGERADEDLSYLSDDTIWQKLRDRIYDSTVTVVFIAFSLRETTRNDRTSHSNALIFVILPDRNNSYDYYSTMRHFNIVASNILNGYAEVAYWSNFVTDIQGYISRALLRKQIVSPNEVVKTV